MGHDHSQRFLVALVLIALVWLVAPERVLPQSKPQAPVAGAGAAVRGEAWFYQRCSLCHMGRIVKDEKHEPMGPRLDGVLENASPEREKLVREQIQRGSPRMPAFSYSFTPAEFDELMAYLRTL